MTKRQPRRGFLDVLQRETFDYFVYEANPINGLIADKTQAGSPASIAAVGFALSSYPVGVERRFMRRADAIARTLATLRFFQASVQSADVNATGYKGFYYHFLDMVSGRRVWKCELSTIDSAILFAGMLTAAAYFSGENEDEDEIRALANTLYLRADWNWAQNGGVTVTHGWKPERGFLRYRWQGYCEAIILYLFGLGSPTHPLPSESWARWTSTYDWRTIDNHELLYAGPLFIHQFWHTSIIFAAFRTTLCANSASTISRIAAAPPMLTSSMRSPIQLDTTPTAKTRGGSPQAKGPGPRLA